jgi:hypothetical protein
MKRCCCKKPFSHVHITNGRSAGLCFEGSAQQTRVHLHGNGMGDSKTSGFSGYSLFKSASAEKAAADKAPHVIIHVYWGKAVDGS